MGIALGTGVPTWSTAEGHPHIQHHVNEAREAAGARLYLVNRLQPRFLDDLRRAASLCHEVGLRSHLNGVADRMEGLRVRIEDERSDTVVHA